MDTLELLQAALDEAKRTKAPRVFEGTTTRVYEGTAREVESAIYEEEGLNFEELETLVPPGCRVRLIITQLDKDTAAWMSAGWRLDSGAVLPTLTAFWPEG